MIQPESSELQEFQDIQETQREIGSLIRRTRIVLGLSAKDMAAQMNYDPSLISKVEKGKNISPIFIDKFLQIMPLDENTNAELMRYREILENARLKNVQIDKGVGSEKLIISKIRHFLNSRWQFAKLHSLQVIGAVLFALAIIAAGIWWYSSVHKTETVLGTINFDRACLEQYPSEPDVNVVLLNEHNVNSWKCEVTKDGTKFGSDIDAMLACRTQYSAKALAAYKDASDAHSWYCYIP